ncbi:unnamed protein product [Effrenium voratum]|uniref:Uncharacterized protein n=1 Tax=Effrenium voratum TaxID=2562239 RepID=A0AA36NCB9_9DINO|nr:unnamed protein product [Effrenium voratum]
MAASLEAKAETDERPEDTKATSKEPLEAAQSLGPATPAGAPVLGQILQSQLALQPENFREETLRITDAILDAFGGPVQYLTAMLGADPSSKWGEFITARRLVDEYLCNSFLTKAEPLLLHQGPESGAAVDANDQPFPQLHHQSMTVISATWSVAATDAASIAIENAKLSARGDIRKGHDTITWLSKLSLLKQKGLSPTEVLRRWNEAATRESALQGQKRTAILQLLELPQESVLLLLEHSSNFGEDTAFAHDAFANKRLSPGFSPRGIAKPWQKRLTVTVDGFNLFIQHVHGTQMRKTRPMRKKWEKAALEEAMSMAQLLVSCAAEMQLQQPGTIALELELQAAISEAKTDFQPADISAFKEIRAICLADRDEKMSAIGQGPRITAGELEKQAFEVMLASADHDANRYRAWRTKCMDRDAAQYFAQLQHTCNRQSQAKQAAQAVFQDGPTWHMRLAMFDKRDAANLEAALQMAEKITKLHQLPGREAVHNLCIINWASPGIYSGSAQKAQANLTGGLCLSPVHFYKRGSLYKAEQGCVNQLANAALNTDNRFAVAYSGRTDERERRALLQPGFILMPGGQEESSAHKATWQFWRSAPVFQQTVIGGVSLLPSLQMLTIEDMHQKLCQTRLRAAILIVDCSAHTLEFAKAVYEERARKSANVPLYYLGFAETSAELEWQQHHLQTWLSEGFLSGDLPLPAGAPALMSKELPAELTSALPPKPELNTLTWSNKKADGLPTLKTPEKVLLAWQSRTRETIPLDVTGDDPSSSRPASVAGGSGTPVKRESAGGESGQPPRKVLKTESVEAKSIPLAELPKPLCWQAALPSGAAKNKGNALKMVITIGKRIFIANEASASEITLPAGATVAGYYKGKFLLQGDRKAEADGLQLRASDCLYQLHDSNSLVVFEGKVATVGQVVAQKRALTPLSVVICYHDLVEQPTPEDAKHFVLQVKNQALFRPENAPAPEDKKSADGCVTVALTSLAGCLETSCWETSRTHLLWAVKWSARVCSPCAP